MVSDLVVDASKERLSDRRRLVARGWKLSLKVDVFVYMRDLTMAGSAESLPDKTIIFGDPSYGFSSDDVIVDH